MNCEDERALFEAHGWTLHPICRRWVAPNGVAQVTTEQVLAFAETRYGETQLRAYVRRFGRRMSA